jgi:hypothetical protein
MISRSDPIDRLEMLESITNTLKRNGVRTVGDLLDKTAADILKMPNLGRKSRNSIREALKASGIWFSGDSQEHDLLFDGQDMFKELGVSRSKRDCSGMTLRDYFAGQALQSLVSMEGFKHMAMAEIAYSVADAMLKARDGKP